MFYTQGDKYDVGAFRISDPIRDFVVASTDMPGVNKDPRSPSHIPQSGFARQKQQNQHKELPHYSEAAKGVFVWGTEKVYHDKYVNNEIIKFDVYYSDHHN